MVFGAWPGQAVGPTAGHGALYVSTCDAKNPMQSFTYSGSSTTPGVLRVAGSDAARNCIDVGGCKHARTGSQVHMFNNSLGKCGEKTTCQGKNEQWTMVPNTGMSRYGPQICICVCS